MTDSKTRCLIVDDEPIAVSVLEDHARKVADLDIVATCRSALEAFDVLQRTPVDLVFLDIHMPELTGIELVKALEHPPAIVFTTAHRDYALEGFELDVVDYLLKPVSLPRFLRAVDKYRRLHHRPQRGVTDDGGEHEGNPVLTVRADRRTVHVPLSDIAFIESLSDYTKIHTAARTVVCREKIGDLSRRLEPQGFVRIHRSFLVALARVTSFTADTVHLGDRALPISRSFRQHARDRLERRAR